MSPSSGFQYVRPVDTAALHAEPSERFVQKLLDRASGAEQVKVNIIRTPPGSGSSTGMHVHDFEQVFYVLSGTMSIEVGSVIQDVRSGSVVVFPRGQEHRNWNAGSEDTVHLSIGVLET